jgi:hypothetical protein
MMASASAPIWLHIGGGILVGLGVAAGSFGIVLAAFARNVEPQQRSIAFGMGTAAGSAGMFVFAPISQSLITALGWSDALVILAVMMLAIPVLAIPLRGNSSTGSQKQSDVDQSIGAALRGSLRASELPAPDGRLLRLRLPGRLHHGSLPAYIGDIGVDASYAVIAIALIGFFTSSARWPPASSASAIPSRSSWR